MYRQVLTVMIALLMAGCADDSGTSEPVPTPSPQTPATGTDRPDADDPVSAAVADLSAHTGVDSSDVEVVSDEEVTWRDGSLGCPEPGKFYTQALVEGYRIVLRVQGSPYYYHGARGKPPFRCDNPSEAAEYSPGSPTR